MKTLEINHVYKFEHCDVECCDRLVETLRAVQTGGLALNCDIVLAGVCLLHRDRRICNRVYRFGEQLPFTFGNDAFGQRGCGVLAGVGAARLLENDREHDRTAGLEEEGGAS